MSALFASGRIIDLLVGLTLLEAVAVVLYRRLAGRGPAPGPFLVNLLAGICMMLALRVALTGGWWGWISLCLLGSLAAHLGDLRWRWRGVVPNSAGPDR